MDHLAAGGIDCDVHPALPGMAALLPYLEPYWREQVTVRGIDGLDLSSFPLRVPAHARPDWQPAIGKAGEHRPDLIRQALDGFGTSIAILNPLYGIQAVYNDFFAAALATAMNKWLAAEWLDHDPRLRGSITIASQNAELAVAEIERCAGDRRFVQILMICMQDAPLGRRQYWPIYAAAERHGLTIGIHAGSTHRHATTSNGWPSFHLEDYVANAQGFQSNLLSLIHEGVFHEYPALRMVCLESGFTWLPNFLWRANRTWRGVRAEVPWVDRPPAEIIRDHVSFTLQPADPPPDAADLAEVIAQIGGDQMLVFSTDYPHWQFDGADPFPAGFPAALKPRVLRDNALRAYPRLKETLT